ncbi:MAG: hypothetical protein WBA12_15870 [Catalinimonas sp.]
MKKALLSLLLFLLASAAPAVAQNSTVVFNYERSQFNDNQPLPAGTYFTLTGEVPPTASMVELNIYPEEANMDKTPLYTNFWKGVISGQSQTFSLPVNYKLRDDTPYDFVLLYYRPVTRPELDTVQSKLNQFLDAYVDQGLQRGRISLKRGPGEMINDLNSIVNSSLRYYRSRRGIPFQGFSDLTRDKIRQVQKMKRGDGEAEAEELKSLVRAEISAYVTDDLVVVADRRYVDNYPTERTRNILTLHAGYGGVYLDGDLDNLSYGSSFKAGLTLPLGQRAYASKFWTNTSIVAGFFVENFDGEEGKVSGPIFRRPTYVGLGYNVFEFVSVTGGVTFLEDGDTAGGLDQLNNRVFLRPFLGLNINIDLWADFSR